MGTGEFRLHGVAYECPDDDLGHVMLRKAKLYWSANIGLQYQTLDWAEYPHPEIVPDIEAYIDKYLYMRVQGLGVTFASVDMGVGKTWGATHILKELVKQGIDGWFVNYSEFAMYKDWDDKEDRLYRMGRVRGAELLVIDEIKEPYTHRMTEYQEDKLEEFVRQRCDRNLPTIVTSNMPEKLFADTFPRVASLLSGKNLRFDVKGDDARMDGRVWEKSTTLALKGESRPIT